MNPEIDLNHFGSGPARNSGQQLVGPPRRILTRYMLPVILLASFAGVGLFAFRDSLQRPVAVTVALPIPASAAASAQIASNPSANAMVVEQVRTTLFQAPGWIEPEPYAIKISSLRMGNVESIAVLEGETVTSGAIIARLVDDDALLAVKSASSALALKRAQVEAAESRWANPTNLKESVETAKAMGERLQAEARRLQEMLDLAKVEADVGAALSKGGYEASLETLRKKTQLSASRNQLAETQAQIRENSATLGAATERLSLRIEDRQALDSAHAEVMAAETALATAQLQLNRSVILAPTSGTIMRLYAAPGSMLSSDMVDGMLIATMYQPDRMQIRVDVPLAEAAKVKPGLRAEIKVEALPERVFSGELINIVPEFDLQKNTLPVKVRIDDPDSALRPEMIARVEFFEAANAKGTLYTPITDRETSAAIPRVNGQRFFIPETSVTGEGENSQVFVVGPDQRAVLRKVITAPASREGFVLVSEGIRISDKVIISPGTAIKNSTLVEVKKVVADGTD